MRHYRELNLGKARELSPGPNRVGRPVAGPQSKSWTVEHKHSRFVGFIDPVQFRRGTGRRERSVNHSALLCGPTQWAVPESRMEDRSMSDVQTRPAGVIIAFPDASARRLRAPVAEGEPRGEILLFTGVRYERMDPVDPSHLAGGTKRRRS
jgi:hypothetical protein